MTQTSLRFSLEYPSEQPGAPDDFLAPEVVRQVAVEADRLGFSAIGLSEHPAPSRKWRDNGGHNTLDPIAALGFMAGVTDRIRLLTNLYVLPFHSPYQAAKALAGLDILSGGRLIAGVGAGYLRSEFAAVGVDFDRRAELFDEALAAVTSIWTDPSTPVGGTGFGATGQMWLQPTTSRPHPPLWIGGNSAAALRRVVAHGNGWMPLITDDSMAAAIRTKAIRNPEEFGAAVEDLGRRCHAAGRDPADIDIQVVCPPVDLDDPASVRRAHQWLADLEGRGATWALIHADTTAPEATLNYLKRFAETFLS